MKGSRQAPMSDDEFDAKFASCLEFGLGATPAQARRLAAVINDLESSADVAGDLLHAFPSAGAATRAAPPLAAPAGA